jgi:hypothetical protein
MDIYNTPEMYLDEPDDVCVDCDCDCKHCPFDEEKIYGFDADHYYDSYIERDL